MQNDRKRPTSADNVIVMPDIYAERLETLEAENDDIELATTADDPEFGFDPYDTARLYNKNKAT